jgi:hypothetical protein
MKSMPATIFKTTLGALLLFFVGFAFLNLALSFRDGMPPSSTVIEVHPSPAPACAPVQVTCECPAYEQGWDDAEFAHGQLEEDAYCSPENLKQLCADFVGDEFAEYEEPDC